MSQNNLIYGKDEIQKITSIEVIDDIIEIFVEGEATPLIKPNRFWILTTRPLGPHKDKFKRLKGDLHYKYGISFNKREDFTKYRWLWRNEDIYNIYDPKESAMVVYGYTSFKGLKHNEVSVLSFDIETTGLDPLAEDAKVVLISNTFRDRFGTLSRKMFCYDEFENDGEMLDAWCEWVRDINPSVIAGHNISIYDFPYMSAVANRYNTSLNIGRNSSAIVYDKNETKFRKDASQHIHYRKPRIYGREVVDTLFLSIKYDVGRKYESYALKKIIAHEGLEVKNRQFYDAAKIRDNYLDVEEFKKIKAYAENDADDSLALYDLMIPAMFYWAQSIPKPFQMIIESATGSQLNSLLVRSYLQEGYSVPKASEAAPYEGAISFAVPGVYRNLKKWDILSAYPSCILIHSIYDKEKDPNANFLKMVKFFMDERIKNKTLFKVTKDPYYDGLQSSQKLGINSAYGTLGTPGLNFNSPTLAAQITRTTREYLNKAIIWASGKDATYWMGLSKDE